jgi:predicted amidohydrolase YtcJ
MAADLIIVNGKVLTMDAARPRAEAVSMAAGRITRVGRNRDVLADKGRKTKVIDANGTTVLPGLIEGHMHIVPGSLELSMLNVEGLNGLEAIRKAVQEFAAAHPGNVLCCLRQWPGGDTPGSRPVPARPAAGDLRARPPYGLGQYKGPGTWRNPARACACARA